jgi:hypothetical protein
LFDQHLKWYPLDHFALVTRLLTFLQGCRARLPGKAAGQGCLARLPGKAAWQGCRARLPGKAAGQFSMELKQQHDVGSLI